MSRLHRATIEDFKRIEIVELDLTAGGVLEISGSNGAGKSSALDAIEAALGGARYTPSEPIRRGAERARVVLEIDSLTVERVWTAKTDRLLVKTKDGFAAGRPQEHLGGLIGPLAFDPIAFCDQPPAEQRATLLRLIGVDLDALDAERQEVYDARRDVNRDLKAEQARLDGMPEPEGEVPDEEVSVNALAAELAEANEAHLRAGSAQRAVDRLAEQGEQAKARVQRLEEELEAARDALSATREEYSTAKQRAKELAQLVPNLDAIRERLAGAEEINRSVRAKAQRREQAKRVEELAAASADKTAAIEAIDQRKAELLAGAKMPVEGLGVTEDGVTYQGVPLSQASQAERIRVGVAICAALSPDLRLALVRQGNDLDGQSKAVLREEADRLDLQVLLEVIKPSDAGAVVIEAGRVRGAGGES